MTEIIQHYPVVLIAVLAGGILTGIAYAWYRYRNGPML